MTKAEIADTQIIVTTPEKWDVVTRKPTGEGELASVSQILTVYTHIISLIVSAKKVKLLIIDEVHLLNEDRGAVIETIVARTLRQVRVFRRSHKLFHYAWESGGIDSIFNSDRGPQCDITKLS